MIGTTHSLCSVTLIAAAMLSTYPTSAAIIPSQTHALSGQSAPGTNRTFSQLGIPLIDNNGHVAFRARTSAGDLGLWSDSTGTLELAALQYQVAPETAGATYSFIDTFTYNDNGQIAFATTVAAGTGDATASNNLGIWAGTPTNLDLLVRKSDPAPDMPGSTLVEFGTPHFNSTGQISLGPKTSSGYALFSSNTSGSALPLRLITRQGATAPGTNGAVFGPSEYGSVFDATAFNDNGNTAFVGFLDETSAGVDSTNNQGIWIDANGSLDLMARKGSVAAGTNNAVFGGFSDGVALNNANQIAFKSFLQIGVGDTTADNDAGLWIGQEGTIDLVARKGAPAAGTNGIFRSFSHAPAINASGQISFTGRLVNGVGNTTYNNDDGIWMGDADSLELIAREGYLAPGTDGIFQSFLGYPILNSQGQIAFKAQLQSGIGSVTSATNQGIWATNSDGEMVLVVREGDVIDVNDDPVIEDLRTVRAIDFLLTKTGGEDGRGTSLSDTGLITFALTFTNDSSSGIFSVDIDQIAVPIPPLVGDLNDDGFVGLDDLDIILNHWNEYAGINNPQIGDITGDSYVGLDDLDMLLAHWNEGTPPQASLIPEPTCVAWILGALGLLVSKRGNTQA